MGEMLEMFLGKAAVDGVAQEGIGDGGERDTQEHPEDAPNGTA